MSFRLNKAEKLQRAAALRALADPTVTASAAYHARLLIRQVEKAARSRAAKTARRPDEPAPSVVHRVEVPPDPNLKKFMDDLRAAFENEDVEKGPAK